MTRRIEGENTKHLEYCFLRICRHAKGRHGGLHFNEPRGIVYALNGVASAL